MPSRRKKLSGPVAERRKKAGFGSGEGKDYKPWIRVCDFPSKGTGFMCVSHKDGHEAHFHSQGEARYFFCYEWCESIVAIQEQFPLDTERTRRIALELGFKPPTDNEYDFVMTSDFRLQIRRGNDIVPVVRTFKRKCDLHGTRLFELLEIERVYYEECRIDWGIITDADIPPRLLDIADWVHDCFHFECLAPLSTSEIREAAQRLTRDVVKRSQVILSQLCEVHDERFGFMIGSSLKLARFLIANKYWVIDHTSLELSEQFIADLPMQITLRNGLIWGELNERPAPVH